MTNLFNSESLRENSEISTPNSVNVKSTISTTSYIKTVVLPMLDSLKNQPIEAGVRKLNGEFIFVTDKYVQQFPSKILHHEIIGKGDAFLLDTYQDTGLVAFIQKLHALVLEKQVAFDCIINNLRSDGNISFSTDIPIFNAQHNCFATKFINRPVDPNQINREMFDRFTARFATSGAVLRSDLLGGKLPKKAELILALLMLGYQQKQLANIFNCSRSNIAKIIAEELCPIFAIEGYSARTLIEKAVALGYDQWIPMELLSSKIHSGEDLNKLLAKIDLRYNQPN